MSTYSGKSFKKALMLLCAAILLTASMEVFARTRTTTRSRGGGGFSRSSTVTGSQGNSATRESQGHWDPETKTWTKTTTVTGNEQQAETE
ncbi:MAG: hypothetical protein WC789_10995 [Lentisphaeria bacterium]